MELISNNLNIPFMRLLPITLTGTLLLAVASIWIWFDKGESKWGIDFTGGTEVVAEFSKPVDVAEVRKLLSDAGYGSAVVQEFEGQKNDLSIRLKSDQSTETVAAVRKVLGSVKDNSFTILKQDFIGPIIGEQIRRDAAYAIGFAIIGMLVYIGFRFEWSFGVGAIVALVHDVIIATGIFLLYGGELSVGVLAALLTIMGYSVNDTIIVFDRIRENLTEALRSGGAKKKRAGKAASAEEASEISLPQIIDFSINQTLSRTVLTSLETLFVTTTLCLLGGGGIHDLAFTFTVGIVIGTYSSIFIASPILILWSGRTARVAHATSQE